MEGNTMLRLKTIFSKPRTVLIAAAILFLPLLFLGTQNSHDWGDDFAQYIHQAGNIVQGIPQSETGYIYSEMNPTIGPKAYPMGFPLLLSPIYALKGNKIDAFIKLVSLFYFLLGLLIIVFLKHHFSLITAFVLSIIFMYNPQMVLFKREVMSDIPFAALLVLNFILYQKTKSGNIKQFVILAFTTGFMLTIRPAGIVFMMAVLMEQFLFLIRRKINVKDFIISAGVISLIPLLVYYLINISIFKIPSGGGLHDYLLLFDPAILFNTITENLAHYMEALRYLYIPQAGILMGFSLILGSVMVTLTVIGFLKRLLQGPEMIEWFFIFYIFMLLGYHYNNSATRLMVPLGFLILFYAATGFKTVQFLLLVPSWKKAVAIGILIMVLFTPGLIDIARSGGFTLDGPQQKTAVEAFKYISKNIPSDSVVVFAKPRALALYGGCRSLADPRTSDPTMMHNQITKANAAYLLFCKQLTDELMYRYSRVMQNRLTKEFENKDFVLYKINPVSR